MWNYIELLTNDDTGSGRLNIGSRQECGTALYQEDTLVKITSSEKVLCNPKLYACSSSDGCIIVADRSVALLDSICQSFQMHIQFDTEVDVVGLCQKGQFLVVGERSGNLHLIHVPSKQTLLTNVLVQKSANEKTYLNLIIEKDNADGGIYHIFILTSNGFFCIMCLPLAKIQEAIDKMDMITAKKLQGMIKTAYISTKDYHTLGCLNFVIGDSMNNILLITGGKGDCVLSKWEVDPSKNLVSVQSFADSSMIKDAVQFQVIDNLLFVLDKENILSMWDVYSLTLIWDWPLVHIEEFLLTTESDSSSVIRQGIASLKLITLTVSVNKQMRNLMVFSLPAMHLLYSLEVSDVSSLVQSGISTDTIYFLEGINENHQKSPEGPVSVLVLRSLTEALPENRLSRLLHKHKFTEAENFAIQFGLDVELVYKVKASAILEKLASSSIGSYGQTVWLDLVDEAKENLHKTQDNHFVVDYCINAPWPTYETTQEMLNYAKIRILKRDDKMIASLSDGVQVSITEVLRAQARLTTFYGAFGPEKFSGIAWTEFLNNEDIFKNILFQLQEGNLPCAQYLWLRHQADFESSFDVKMLEDLLNTICATIPVKELCLWFKNVVIPFVRRVVPKGQKILAKWLEQGARYLELTDKANWPENGLQMAEVFFTSKNPGELGLASSWRWIPLKCGDCEEVHRLKKLVNDLQELVDLYRKYSCKLALCDFEKENASTIVFRMFDKVLAPELIPSILEKFIKPYIHEHNLQQDELLLQYIKDLLERCRTRSTSVFETAWEAKAIAVIGCISDTDLIFDAVLQIMHGAVVPWSAAVEQLVKQHLEMKHVKVKLLQESSRLMEMKKLLRGYGIRDTNLLKDKQMIMRLVKYILKQDTPTSLEDALKIVAAYMLPSVEVYILRMVDLIDQDRGEESLNLLKSLPVAEAEKVAERLSIWARLVLQKEADNSEERKTQMCITKTLVEVLKFLLSIQKENPLKEDECKANLKMFETLASLQEDFDIFISVKDYGNHLLMSQLLEEHIKAYESIQSMAKSRKVQATNSKDDSKTKNCSTESRLYKLALLLQRTEQELGAKLALRSLDAGKIEEALKICRDLYEHHCNEQTGKLLFLACQKLCHMLGADVPMITPKGLNFPAVINEMACQAATICSPDLLLDSLELCKYTVAAKEIYGQCQIENYGFIAKAASFGADKDPYEEWTYDDFFSEDGIVLDPQMALPVAYETISSLVPIADNKMYPLDSAVALVGAQLASHYGEPGEIQKFKELIIDAEWGIQLGKLGISFQTVFRQPSIRKKELIRTLVQNPNVDTDLILKYCRTFMLDSDAALQLCIETLLLQSANTNQVEGDSAGDTVKQPHSTLLAKSVKIIPLLKSTKDLVISLSGILHKLDPYDYETIENVLRVIQRADENSTSIQLNQALSLLKHLESYKRTSPPVDLEHQYILEHVISLSPAAQTRLPFHLIFFRTTQCFWSIISAELTEESFPTLLLISKLMKVSLDTLYMSAARHVFEKKLKAKVFELTKAGCSSVINKETTKTVQTIQSYLLSIVNPEWAVAIAHKIAQELPTGPDQIQALKFCLYLAEKWLTNTTTKDESHEKAEVLLKKLRMQYQRSATETVLITHKLSTAEHLKLTGKPANLIVLLYEHSSINQRIQNPTNRDYPDIHAAAKEIAEINNLDMNKIWDKLLEKWLCPNIPTDEKTQSFGDVQEDEELRRVIYLLQPRPMDYSSRMLFAITTSATSPIGVNQLTFAQRSRALKCLIYLADADTVESLFKKPIEKVKYFLQCFIYLAELETLNIPYTYESFHRSPKEGMIKGLWKNHSHEPTAARLVTELSLEYKVYDPQLWSGLLQKLLGFNMIHYLSKVLIAITGVPSLWQIPNFSRAWRSVILAPFLAASCPPSPKQLEACCECFVVLLKCPVLADLDIIGIARQYAQLDLTAFALGCLLLIPQTEKREQQIQGFLASCNPETVLQQVDEHMNTGEVAGFASQIRCLILDNIINEKQYERFLKTKYFPLLKLQVMNTHRVKELVDYLANKSCMDDAAALIVEYQKRCGNPILEDRSSCDILKMFLSGPE
ncbi:ankyrin repeat domain-containing protein 65 [Platysternon megacephalum]|uniref:Ankyrin repeat domain-containing protein 65 n=1 Tax=Platysternon megacephalum TaxID=55544 RepID=A0A4D9F7V3_9SAUR|nr:ankyrin repeat domain-containing protein 65 [Platysternon megacephalum]